MYLVGLLVCICGVCLLQLTWQGSLGTGAGPFGAGGDAGEAEDGSQEADHKSHDDRTLNPVSDSCGHTGLRPQGTGVTCGISPTCPFSHTQALTAENSSNPPTHVLAGFELEARPRDPQGTSMR